MPTTDLPDSAPLTSKPDTLLARETERRRTFAIISHPDAGKTTLTEKLLLYGGAIHLGGLGQGAPRSSATPPPTGWSSSRSAASR